MAYGITSKSQIIDLNTIKNACSEYITALDDLINCSEKIKESSVLCDKKALSVDNNTLQPELEGLASEIVRVANEYKEYAQDVISQATSIYNTQVREYEEYLEELERNKNTN